MLSFTLLTKSEVKLLTGLITNHFKQERSEKSLNQILFAVNDIAVRKQTEAIRETQRLLSNTTLQKKLI